MLSGQSRPLAGSAGSERPRDGVGRQAARCRPSAISRYKQTQPRPRSKTHPPCHSHGKASGRPRAGRFRVAGPDWGCGRAERASVQRHRRSALAAGCRLNSGLEQLLAWTERAVEPARWAYRDSLLPAEARAVQLLEARLGKPAWARATGKKNRGKERRMRPTVIWWESRPGAGRLPARDVPSSGEKAQGDPVRRLQGREPSLASRLR
jgi:hypothetical protein